VIFKKSFAQFLKIFSDNLFKKFPEHFFLIQKNQKFYEGKIKNI